MKTSLMTVVAEMTENAAKSIGAKYDDGMLEMVILNLKHDYDIELNPEGPVTIELMEVIVEAIHEWKCMTKDNHPELCGNY